MKILRSGIFVALWLALVGVASAQETTGTLIGRLQDSQGLALPGVTVTATGAQGVKIRGVRCRRVVPRSRS